MTSTALDAVKQRIADEVKRLHPRLVEISHAIHANPELAFQEKKAAALLAAELEQAGFRVTRGVAGLETAFTAVRGEGKPRVAFLAEYDALAKIGHGCGHNLIGTWAVGAAVALARACPDAPGSIEVIGTPAEEGGGGKVILADAGVFRGLDAAIMMHPREFTLVDRGSLAITRYQVEFFGKSAHASTYPEKGINALDAVLQVFFSLNALRQMLKPGSRIHGVITHGGDAPNIIPDYASAKILLRAREQDYLEELEHRFTQIVEGAALATGARPKLTRGISYKTRVCNRELVEALRENLLAMGLTHEEPPTEGGVGSSDIGNVSHLVPTIHPYFQICDPGIVTHSPEFAVAAAEPRADETLLTGATLLARTGADVLLRADLRDRMRASFRKQLGREPQA
jgi:amidohydrolase